MQHPDRQLLIAYVDGLLTSKQADELLSHANICPDCKIVIEQEAAMSSAMRTQPLAHPGPGFDRAVLDAVLPRTSNADKQALPLRKFAGIFALCIFTLIIFLFSTDGNHDSAAWVQPVKDAVSGFTGNMTEYLVQGIQRLFVPFTATAAHSSILEIIGMATVALLLLGGIDHIISPLLKKGR
ncbi:MAG: zf-HC2 domain-containing protein [Bacteroidota bacterium]